jgi:formylglycine-generating enzyme required for sulfatase activity
MSARLAPTLRQKRMRVWIGLAVGAAGALGVLALRGPRGAPSPAPSASGAATSAVAPGGPAPAACASATPAPGAPPPALRGGAMARIPGGRIPRCFAGEDDWCCGGPDIEVGAFDLDVDEVTLGDYEACAAAGACSLDGLGFHHWCNHGAGRWGRERKGRERHPVNCVGFEQARAFCAWAGKRLPTLDEWALGARGAEGRRYPWGSEDVVRIEDALAKGGCFRATGTCPVGEASVPGAPFGLHDMAGNVAEWVEGSACELPAGSRDGRCRFPKGGACEHEPPVACGTSWADPDLDEPPMLALTRCRPLRTPRRPTSWGYASETTVGFRCARSP